MRDCKRVCTVGKGGVDVAESRIRTMVASGVPCLASVEVALAMSNAVYTLCHRSARNREVCGAVGVPQVMVTVMCAHGPSHADIAYWATAAVNNLCIDAPGNVSALITCGGLDAIYGVMLAHPMVKDVQACGSWSLDRIIGSSDSAAAAVVSSRAMEVLSIAKRNHPGEKWVDKALERLRK